MDGELTNEATVVERAETAQKTPLIDINIVREAIKTELDIDPENVTPDTLLDDFDPDSLDMLDLVMELEELAGATISDELMAKFTRRTTVRQMIDLINNEAKPD
ncbi:MAG TPA: phosphopantetheine-binding protein [Candidatus Peribacterales bacterium]|nr:phosphopantetheine-binding protein [Candidatus Peribacterales bacterium]